MPKNSVGSQISRRQTERLTIEVPVEVKGRARGKGFCEQTRTLDVSRGGVSFSSHESYRPAMKVRLSFLETQNLLGKVKEIPAEVVRVISSGSDGRSIVAIRFEDARLANLVLTELLRSKFRTNWALLDILQAFIPGSEVQEVIQSMCRTVQKAMDSERALLFLRDLQQGVLRARASIEGSDKEFQIGVGQGLVGQAAQSDRPTRVENVAEDPRFRPDLENYFDASARSALCVPLAKEDSVSPGVLVVFNKRYHSYTAEDEGLAAAVANQISVVLREARLFEDIRNMKNYNEGILQSIASAVFTFNRSGELVTFNRAAAELCGSPIQAQVGKHYSEVIDRNANPRLCSVVEDVLTKQRRRTTYDARFLRSDGATFSLNLSAFPLKDAMGNFMGAVLVTEDITQEHRLITTLSRYVAREVAEQVLRDRDGLKLGGTRTDVTIFFADIRNFTSMAERMAPEDVVNLLNTYYPRIINAVFRHHGMVDKFIGDAVLAVFGVPTPRPDDALRAVRAALDIRKDVRAINKERLRKEQLAIEIGIGITSGIVISGNIGSQRRMDYTVIGDPVNLAARLEGLTKELEHKILISDRVHAAIEKEVPCEALGLFRVRGKQEEVPVFAVKTPD